MAEMIGLKEARRRGWRLVSSCDAGYKIKSLRAQGAVVVDTVYNGDRCRSPWVTWWGLPPGLPNYNMMACLARDAGQFGPQEYGQKKWFI